jgi:4-amino-4-deoxy-L-arabinose transferase-like glycosyltransferase
MSTRRIWLAALLIFLFALVIRLSYLDTLRIDHPIQADAAKYFKLANNLLNRGVYSDGNSDPLKPTGTITPGYPLVLATILSASADVNSFYRSTLNFQAVAGSMTAVVVFLIGLRMLSAPAAIVAAGLTALAPHQVTISGYVLTECLFALLMCGAIYFLILAIQSQRLRYCALFGVAVGLAVLVRPAILLFPIAAIPLLWARFPPWLPLAKACSLSLVGLLLFWSPWLAWKRLSVTPDAGQYSPVAAQIAFGMYPNLTHKTPAMRGFPNREDPQYESMIQSLPLAFRTLSERAQAEPWKYLKWYLIGKPSTFWSWSITAGKGLPFIYPVKSSLYQQLRVARWSLHAMRWTHAIFVLAALFAAIVLFVRAARRKAGSPSDFGACAVVLLLVYFTLIHTLLAPLPRYSIPLHGPMYLLAIFGLMEGFRFVAAELSSSPTS